MANVIKHKRGSGSDPSASDLILGELAIRTDNGKLFTKMDSGAIAEIAGGGSDIAINTLSSSSATGGGSATFNGSAYRFTLSSPPSVSAAQLLVSVNGVIQKPVAGTGQPSEGFSVSGNDIIFGDAPATGADFFILTFRSLGVSEPADNSVTSAKIVDGAIVNADINASAAIAGSKISPNFGSQSVNVEDGYAYGFGDNTYRIEGKDDGVNARIGFVAASSERMRIDASGRVLIGTTTEGEGDADNLTIAGSGNIGITIRSGTSNDGAIFFSDGTSGNAEFEGTIQYLHSSNALTFKTNHAERMRIDSSGNVGIGASSITANTNYNTLQIQGQSGTGGGILRLMTTDGSTSKAMIFADTGGLSIRQETSHPIVLSTDNSERMRIDSSGRLLVGTTTEGFASYGDKFTIANSGHCGMTIRSGTSNDGNIYFSDGTSGVDEVRGFVEYKHSDNSLNLGTNGATRFSINSSGNIGIGTTSPSQLLHIKAANPVLEIEGTATSSGDTGVFLNANGNHWFLRSDNFGSQNSFSIKSGTPASSTHRLFIDSSGNIGIGTTQPTNADSADGGLQIRPNLTNGAPQLAFKRAATGNSSTIMAFVDGSTGKGSITYDNTGTNYNETSDYRLKENVVLISDGITRLKTLKPSRFNFIDDETNTLRDGFIAHEVSSIVPEAVTGEKDEVDSDNKPVYQGIDHSKLVPLLVAAVQELTAKVEALEAK